MRFRLDPGAREPLSAQLAAEIGRRVDRGRLLPGDRLPSVRELATQLGLAPNTVAKAYRALERDGLLEGRGRRGTFVADRLAPGSPEARARLRRAAETYASSARRLGFDRREARGELDRAFGEP